ncbi:MAG: hypothetical protein ACXWDL_01860 [Nocardioides sp.]
MGVRATVLLLLAVLVGGAAGWVTAERTSGPVVSDTAPRPVAADPALPFSPPEKVKPNPDLAPLSETLPMHDERVGTPRDGGIVVPVPSGWEMTTFADDRQAKWSLPDGPAGGYALRVQILDENRTVSQKVAVRPLELEADDSVSDLEIVETSFDTLTASFIFDGYRRLTVIRWVSFSGGLVDVEIAATGRLVDEGGMEALVARIAQEVRPQPLPERKQAQKPGAPTSSSTS